MLTEMREVKLHISNRQAIVTERLPGSMDATVLYDETLTGGRTAMGDPVLKRKLAIDESRRPGSYLAIHDLDHQKRVLDARQRAQLDDGIAYKVALSELSSL